MRRIPFLSGDGMGGRERERALGIPKGEAITFYNALVVSHMSSVKTPNPYCLPPVDRDRAQESTDF